MEKGSYTKQGKSRTQHTNTSRSANKTKRQTKPTLATKQKEHSREKKHLTKQNQSLKSIIEQVPLINSSNGVPVDKRYTQ